MCMMQAGYDYDSTPYACDSATYYRARYYDPNVGRFISEDPLRFTAGTNFYNYVDNDPIDGIDPMGLVTYICTKPLHALGSAGQWAMDNIQWVPLFHEYFCVEQGNQVVCGGQDHAGNPLWSKGKPSDDNKSSGRCSLLDQGHDCFEDCIKANIENPNRPDYSVQRWPGKNCQQWAEDVVQRCTASCRAK